MSFSWDYEVPRTVSPGLFTAHFLLFLQEYRNLLCLYFPNSLLFWHPFHCIVYANPKANICLFLIFCPCFQALGDFSLLPWIALKGKLRWNICVITENDSQVPYPTKKIYGCAELSSNSTLSFTTSRNGQEDFTNIFPCWWQQKFSSTWIKLLFHVLISHV